MRRRKRFTHVPEEFSDGDAVLPVYNIMQQLRNNVRPPGLATLLGRVLFYQRYSSSINSFLSLLALSRDARFSGQDLWNGTLYSSILAYASIYSPRGKAGLRRHLIPKVSRNSYSVGSAPTGCLKSVDVFPYVRTIRDPISVSRSVFVQSRIDWSSRATTKWDIAMARGWIWSRFFSW